MRFPILTLAFAAFVSACGSTPSASPSAQRTATPRPTPTPTPTPDTLTVTVVSTGAGSYQLATFPVAILHNDSTAHGATQVVAHFVTRSESGAQLGSLDSVAVNLAPGETLPVSADCTDGCNGAAGTDVTVTVGAWVTALGVSPQASPATYACGTCGGGHGYGSVTGTLTATHLGKGAAVAVFADCEDAAGAISGGGTRQIIWPGGTSFALNVPVIVSRPPAVCHLGASTGW